MKTNCAKKALATLLFGGMLTVASTVGAAPTDDYYIFSDEPDDAWVVRNGVVQQTFSHSTDDLAIAVGNTIRALQWDLSGDGSEYDLNGNVLTPNAYAPIPGASGQVLDGTTDGSQHNYTAEWSSVSGTVWQTDRDWANGVPLFDTETSVTGITYDGVTSTLWIAEDNTGTIFNYDLAGNIVGAFNVGPGRWGALAWEPSTDTLWMINNDNSQVLQTDKIGTTLSSMFIQDFGNVWGGEFSMVAQDLSVPEPATFAILGLGLAGLGFSSRAKKPH